jgi:hypothetical protein
MGYVRTATTMHQRHVFSQHENINFIGKPFPRPELMQAFRDLACQDEANFDGTAGNLLLKESAASSHNGHACTLLSDEIMLSPLAVDITILLSRLQDVFGEIKVLLTIRNQADTFQSWMEHVLKKSEYGRIDDMSRYHLKFKDTRDSMLNYLDYGRYYSFLSERLGKERVLALPFELMKQDLHAYCRILSNFLGVPAASLYDRISAAPIENARRSRKGIAWLDYRKSLYSGRASRKIDLLAQPLFVISGRAAATEERLSQLRQRLIPIFSPKNIQLRRALLDDIGVDIAALGYPLPEGNGDG